MPLQVLVPHPDLPPPAGVTVATEWAMSQAGQLVIAYRVGDPHGAILWPAPATGRSDNLWQHSCFEAFVGSRTMSAYAEFNLAPSGAWAAYAFDDYRSGMRPLYLVTAPVVARPGCGHYRATIHLAGLDDLLGAAPWRLAVTAVIEAQDGSRSYWSLVHPLGKPDFHHADCFAARLG